MNNFRDTVLIKLGNLSPRVWMNAQPLHIFQYGIYEIPADFRRTLLPVVVLDLLEISQGGTSDNDLHLLSAK